MTASSPPAIPLTRPRRRFWRSWRGWVLIVLLALVAFIAISVLLAKKNPSWYHPMDGHDPRVQQLGTQFRDFGWTDYRNKLESVTQATPEQTIVVEEKVINAYLAVAYLTNEGNTRGISGPMVMFTPGQVTLAATVDKVPGIGSGVLSMTFHVEVTPSPDLARDPSTQIAVKLDSVSIGALPVPRWLARKTIAGALEKMAPELDGAIRAVRRKENPESHELELRDFLSRLGREEAVPLPHEYRDTKNRGRPVFLHAIVVTDGKMEITLKREPMGK